MVNLRVAIPKLGHGAHVRVARAKLGAISKEEFRMKLKIRIHRDDVRIEIQNLALDDEDFANFRDALAPVVARVAVRTIPVVINGIVHDDDVFPPGGVVHRSIQPEVGLDSNLLKFWLLKTR